MYMRNSRYNKYAKYNIEGFPDNYSGQYKPEQIEPAEDREPLHNPPEHQEHKEHKEHENPEKHEKREKKDGSLLGNLFGGHKDGKKGGLLSGLFNKNDSKEGGLLSNIELEDLILLAVIFFLLKDGIEDDMIIILALILFSS